MIYHIKNMCHHIEHTLFYLWLKYEAIWTNIASLVESFSIKLWSGTWFLNHLSWHLRTCFNHPNPKKSPPFQLRSISLSNEKQNLPNKLFRKCNAHSYICSFIYNFRKCNAHLYICSFIYNFRFLCKSKSNIIWWNFCIKELD